METKFLEQYKALPPSPHRVKAWARFSELGMPSKKISSYQYISLQKLYAEDFKAVNSVIPSVVEENTLVFINGKFDSTLSRLPQDVILLTLEEALKTYSAFLNNRFVKLLKEEKDPFVALNMALASDSAFIYVPPKVVVEKPIKIIHYFNEAIVFPRLHVFMGAFSKASFTSNVWGDGSFFLNQLHDFSIEEGAEVTYTSKNIASEGWHFEALRANLKKESKFTSYCLNEGAKSVRQDYKISLIGENAEAFLYGLSDLKENRQAHTNVYMNHVAPCCRSSQHFKAVLNDTAKSSFEGKIYVHAEAQKTDAFQLSRHLLLSPHVIANTKPNLEIFADDVKASHGATVGQLDKEALFYLKSRGIKEEDAKELLIQAFSREILDKVPHVA